MNSAGMHANTPYIVTRGSAALRLVRGDRVQVCRDTDALTSARGGRWLVWRGYAFSVELDRAGLLERAAQIERELILERGRIEALLALEPGP